MTTGRVVDVIEHGQHLALDGGFLVVRRASAEVGRVPLDDVSAVIVSAYGCSYTNPVVVALASRGAVLVACDARHKPVAWVLPVAGHYAQARIMAAQTTAPRPLIKRLWQYVVRMKIRAQATALEVAGRERSLLDPLVERVASGDPHNIEATAAQRYWPAMFGRGFTRDREAPGVNALLNYGYTVLRGAVARAVVASGLHPGVSLRHRRDPLALVDDLIEPFRAAVDVAVWRLGDAARNGVSREGRTALVGVLDADGGTGSLARGIEWFVRRMAAAYVNRRPPRLGERHVDLGDVRPANDHGRAPQGRLAIPRSAASRGVRADAAVGVSTGVPESGGGGTSDA